MTGAALPPQYEFDGNSLVPFLCGETETHRDTIYSYNAQYQMVRTRSVLRGGLGYFWDTRGTLDQQAYRDIPEDTSDPVLQDSIATIRKVLLKYPTAPTSGPMFDRYMSEKAGKWALWEKVQTRVCKEVEKAAQARRQPGLNRRKKSK